VALTYLTITALGTLIGENGTDEKLTSNESPIAVLLSPQRRRQLALQIEAARSSVIDLKAAELPVEKRHTAERRFREHLRVLGEHGLVHRCMNRGDHTVYLHPHDEGAGCEWADCPSGVFSKPANGGRTAALTAAAPPPNDAATAATPIREASEGESSLLPAGRAETKRRPHRRSEHIAAKTEQVLHRTPEEQEALGRVKTMFNAVDQAAAAASVADEITTTLTDLVVGQFIESLIEETEHAA
jgi:hypothetical protein